MSAGRLCSTCLLLITGGASQMGTAVAKYLKQAGKDVVFATCSGCVPDAYNSVKHDWTYSASLNTPFASGLTYCGVYLVSPPGFADAFKNIKALIDMAFTHGVRRFMILSGTGVEKDGALGLAKMHRYLEEKGVDYFALQPTWFMDNFIDFYSGSINERDEFKTVIPNANIPLISVEDIGRQAAEVLSGVLRRKISHSIVAREELMAHYIEMCGYPLEYANFVVTAELENDRGAQEKWWGHPDNLVGTETLRARATRFKSSRVTLSGKIDAISAAVLPTLFPATMSPLIARGLCTGRVDGSWALPTKSSYQSLSLTLSYRSSEMSILITGGNSQTGLATAKYLKEAGKRPVIASRRGVASNGFNVVKLDWSDPSTLEAPFADGQTYEGVYLLSPMTLAGVVDVTPAIINFIDIAAARGVKRFVFISGCMVDKNGDHGHAKIHKHLEAKNVDHLVLKPPMFMDNLLVIYAKSIRDNDEIVSDTPNAKFPMISVEDIGRLAAKAFLNEKNEHTEQYMVGPELLTLDQAAEILSDVLDRKITHRVVKPEQMVEFYMSVGPELGWSREMAQFVVMAEALIDAGAQEKIVAYPNNLVGDETFRQWAERFKHVFTRSG
ncbi:hypothetical protein NMY22_g8765 [Coprinellus aureogranulatus]|nr:hypothetical protein NMY22_g8765 [Coprinellus aureogranulatus]